MTTTVDLSYSEEEQALAEVLRASISSMCTSQAVAAAFDGDRSLQEEAWTRLAQADATGVLVPEAQGGSEQPVRVAAVIAEVLGACVAPVPFLPSAVLAARLLVAVGESELTPALAAGQAVAAVVVSPVELDFPAVALDGDRVSSTAALVLGAAEATHLVVRTPDGLRLVEAAADGVEVEATNSLDMTRPLATVRLDRAPSRRISDAEQVPQSWRSAVATARIVLASEQLGLAQRAFDLTLAYARERRQFGRAIGSFQAIKHRLAELWTDLALARTLARYAAVEAKDGSVPDDLERVAGMAQAYCSELAVRVAETCVQIHGGIAMTWEHEAHLLLKRARTDHGLLGRPAEHRARLAELVDLPS